MLKSFLRNYLINLVALALTNKILPGLSYSDGIKALLIGALVLMIINLAVIPLLKIMFLPLNLITLGVFTWVINVLGLYLMTTVVPQFKLMPYTYPGINFNGFVVPEIALSVLMVAIAASFLVGLISHFLHWLIK